MKTKILFVINVISHYQIPLLNRLADLLGGTIKIVSVRDIPKTRKNLGWAFKKEGIKFGYDILQEKGVRLTGRDVLFSWGIFRVMFDRDIDKVVIGGYYTVTVWVVLFIAKLRGLKVILRSGTQKYSVYNHSRFNTFMKKLFVRNVDTFVVYGTMARDYIIGLGADPEKIWIEYDTVDVAALQALYKTEGGTFEPVRVKWKAALGLEGPTIVYVGQLIPRKNVATLIEAARLLQERQVKATLVVVGSGALEDELKRQIADYQLDNVLMVGPKPYEDVMKYYMAADVFTTMSLIDPYPLVVNESMSFGCPVIISQNCGNSTDLVEGNGVVVENPMDHETLAFHLENFLADPEALQAMGEQSHRIISQYDIENAAQAIYSAIELTNNSDAS